MQTLEARFIEKKFTLPGSNPGGQPLPEEVVQGKFKRDNERAAANVLEQKLQAAGLMSDPMVALAWAIVKRGATSESMPLGECQQFVSNLTARLTKAGYEMPPGFAIHQLT